MKHNPFLITGYKSHEYFCNRNIETERLKSAINNQRNITLISSRRMGKTGLIMHVFGQISKDKSQLPIYFDIMGTTALDEFAEVKARSLQITLKVLQSTILIIVRSFSYIAQCASVP